ncbi:unnamed protein product, partial [Linum tenue]
PSYPSILFPVACIVVLHHQRTNPAIACIKGSPCRHLSTSTTATTTLWVSGASAIEAQPMKV